MNIYRRLHADGVTETGTSADTRTDTLRTQSHKHKASDTHTFIYI